jgi:ABC-type transport system involved in multi-copper enzyme maturation permease subunit
MTAVQAVPAIFGYTLRACLPLKRRLGLLLPCLGALLFGLLARLTDESAAEGFAAVADVGLFTLVLPIACLVVGDAVLGAEVRSGTLAYTWLSPVPFSVIVAGRWLGGFAITAVTVVPSCMLAAMLAGAGESAPSAGLAAMAGCAAYVGLFIMIGCVTQRAAVWSLAIVFLVERLVGSQLSGIAQLSPTWESRAVFAGLAPDASDLFRKGIPEGWGAVSRLAVITAITLAIASWRLGHLRLSGASD